MAQMYYEVKRPIEEVREKLIKSLHMSDTYNVVNVIDNFILFDSSANLLDFGCHFDLVLTSTASGGTGIQVKTTLKFGVDLFNIADKRQRELIQYIQFTLS